LSERIVSAAGRIDGAQDRRPLRVFLAAGEASGDLHGGALAEALRKEDPDVDLIGLGGPAMRSAGVRLLHSIDRLAVLGVAEVLSRLPFFWRVLRELESDFRREPPDLFIAIDFPDFNIRLAGAAKRAGIPVLYYISPQVWAWRRGRVSALKRIVDRMVVVFPFEVDFYRQAGVPVEFVGHPLLDRVKVTRPTSETRDLLGLRGEAPLVALLPGSRVQEVERILPALARAGRRLEAQGVACVVSRAASVPEAVLRRSLRRAGSSLLIWEESVYDLLAASNLAVVASGTATLEAGLLSTPLIVVYRLSPLSWWIGRTLVKLPNIGLVNIAAGERIAPELLQDEVTGENVAAMARGLLDDPETLGRMREKLGLLKSKLGGPGASERAARIALDLVSGSAGSKLRRRARPRDLSQSSYRRSDLGR
jgi:lipid-A-disaccharide synthase